MSRADGAIELTVCETCGREAAPTETDLARYRAPNPWLESQDRAVVAFARSVRGGSVDMRMRRLVTAVQTRLSGPVSYREYATAHQALDLRGGDCTEYALLLAAAGRARGIPTRVVAGLAYGSRFAGKPHVFGPHMWVQAWNGKRWVSYDAGLGSFDAGHLAIAVGDGSPESLQGALRLISSLRIIDAEGLVQASSMSATQP
ncbi:transglutaminase-like domain-containing protein [Lysobacter tyrosinilyticus]